MKIQDLFRDPIDRPINGVIKADQLDGESIWQELKEFEVTRELTQHIQRFFDMYLKALDNPDNPDIAGNIGVWISGFFGSGKSHFIKVLSYLLSNREVQKDGKSRKAIEFFKDKINDTMLAADIERAIKHDTDVILFNIDSKADTGKADPILTVFLNVFNDLLGYSPDHPHIADLERSLDEKGKLTEFKLAYLDISGNEWIDDRDAFYLNTDSVRSALSRVLGQSEAAFDKWLDDPESVFHLSPENFVEWVKQYLDSKGPEHRIIFLVDEIGQFIGNDGQMMLRLQTITENLGTVCNGRAWVIVTSQEDIEAVLGELKTSTGKDFSKIQGRFKTRLSLSSANVDEVIQARLLTKTPEAAAELFPVYTKNADILKHQLAFTNIGTTFKAFDNDKHFAAVYPFAPYQFQLVQKIFEAIRRIGATGAHLSRGERSMLDGFQHAAVEHAQSEIGVLVPLHSFYPSIESFLDTAVKATIDNAADNPSLEKTDGLVLRTLFLIRYVEEIKGTLDNIVTLFINRIDADRVVLRTNIEASLQRLESQTLVRRNGDEFFFLTDEERDIGRGIKSIDLMSGEEAKALAELVFVETLKDNRKFRFGDTKKDFQFNRFCDLHPHGHRVDGDLAASVISPLADDYPDWNNPKCLMVSNENDGQVVVKLRDDRTLGRELRTWLQTEKYISRTSDGSLPASTKRILKDRADENRQRRANLIVQISNMLKDAEFFAAGQAIQPKGGSGEAAIREALDYLVRNTFTKLSYLKKISSDPQAEIRAILTAPDTADQRLDLSGSDGNGQALKEVLDYVRLMELRDQRVVLNDLVETRFGKRPYGWPEWDIVLLVLRLVMAGEVSLVSGGSMSRDQIAETVKSPQKWRNITVAKRQTVDTALLQQARNLGKTVFARMGPDGEDALYEFLRTKCDAWRENLSGYLKLAETGIYPGKPDIESGLTLLRKLLAQTESFGFIKLFLDLKTDFEELSDQVADLDTFYTSQRPVWDTMKSRCAEFSLNEKEIERDLDGKAALAQMQAILSNPEPYRLIMEAEGLIAKVAAVNSAKVQKRREHALGRIDIHIKEVKAALDQITAAPEIRNSCLFGLQNIRARVEADTSIAHIYQSQTEAEDVKDDALEAIEKAVRERNTGMSDHDQEEPDGDVTTVFRKPRIVRPASLKPAGYLKSKEDIDAFIDALRAELENALKNDEPIDIR